MLVIASVGCGRVGFDPTDDDVVAGLRFRFELDETSGRNVPDSSGNGLDGFVFGVGHVVWDPAGGKIAGALRFDGIPYQSFVLFPSAAPNCSAAPVLTGSITASTWAKFDTFEDWNGYTLGNVAIMQGTTGGTQGGWGLGATNGCGATTVGFTITPTNTTRVTRCGSTPITTGVWYYVTGVFDATGQTVVVYLDGIEQTGALTPNSNAIGTSTNQTNYCAYLGASANQANLLVGSLDQTRVYDRALSAAEVLRLYRHAGG
ncbi:MAG: hypothetical protein JWO36_7293 [Myxococcales bacterium]|nr:hypothetical protein [Myxococcales bacterium]